MELLFYPFNNPNDLIFYPSTIRFGTIKNKIINKKKIKYGYYHINATKSIKPNNIIIQMRIKSYHFKYFLN